MAKCGEASGMARTLLSRYFSLETRLRGAGRQRFIGTKLCLTLSKCQHSVCLCLFCVLVIVLCGNLSRTVNIMCIYNISVVATYLCELSKYFMT